jgi:glycine/D-amino acid oxidase-like deaminating enzyme
MPAVAPPSPWLLNPPALQPPLQDDHQADVAVIGAGFTGLSTALELRRHGFSVIVLEANTVGFGASGRNAGHLTPTIGKDLPTLTKMYGRERVAALVHLAETAITHTENLIREHAIDCEYEAVGNIIAAIHERQYRNLDRAAKAAAAFGIRGELLEPTQMRRRGLPPAFARGYFEPHGGILHPGRYVRGLCTAALAAGASVHESSAVTSIEEGESVAVRTAQGSVRCRSVVLATNAYTPMLGRLRSSGVRLHVQLFRTEPLTAAQLAAVGWPGREGIYTAHEMLESYRLTADNRIVGGAKTVRAAFGNAMLEDVDASVAAELERVFRQRFPQIRDVRITDHWGGPIFMSLDFLPVVGRAGRHANILHSIAYAGHGVAQASYAGAMIADLLLGRDGPGAALWSRRRIPVPPEPFRWLAYKALTRFFAGIDRRSDTAAER